MLAAGNEVTEIVNASISLTEGYWNYTVVFEQGRGAGGLVLYYSNSSSTTMQVLFAPPPP